MSTEKLLPCSVCGGEARLNRDGYSLDLRVRCDECGARTEDFETDKEAIAAWNRRSSPPAAVPEGWVMVPLDCTDEIAEAIAFEANCCGGIAETIWRKAISAAPAAPNGWQPLPKDTPEGV